MIVEEFEWDEGNREKNWIKHRVSVNECEGVFQDISRVISYDTNHSQGESRYSILGKTLSGRRLQIIYTIRDSSVRVVSARDQSKKERRLYEQTEKTKKA